MIVKPVLAGALALVFSTQEIGSPTTFTTNPYVEKVSCVEGSGTAFKIEDGRWVSVDHVSKHSGCLVDGQPVEVVTADPLGDFSTLKIDDPRLGGLPVRCEPLRKSEWVFAIGHARGDPFPQIMPLMFVGKADGARFGTFVFNRVIPGMSGGPVVDAAGRVVGTVNAYNIFYPVSFSRLVVDTELCK